MNPNDIEINLSRVYCFINEIKTGEFNKKWYEGYHPNVYCKFPKQEELDKATAELCGMLKQEQDVFKFSKELNFWWVEHQKADNKKN